MAAFREECDGQRVLVSPPFGIIVGTRKTLHTPDVDLRGGGSWAEVTCGIDVDYVWGLLYFLGFFRAPGADSVTTYTGRQWSSRRWGWGASTPRLPQ